MNHNARRLTTLTALTLGIAIAAYSLRVMSNFHTQATADSGRVVDLGTIRVTPQDAFPPLGRDGVRYALRSERRRADAHDQIRSAI